MADEKVTSEVETVRAVLREVIAERFKLSAEVERLTRLYADAKKMWTADVQEFGGRYKAAEAKLTALVEVVEAARDLVMKPGGLVNRGVGVGLVVVEKADKSDPHYRLCTAFEKLDAQVLAHHSAPVGEAKPIPMLLFCPKCGVQHVDEPDPIGETGGFLPNEPGADVWTNPPHRSHLCDACGCIWRPADVPTEGVEAITTKGKSDTWSPTRPHYAPAPPATPTSAPVEDVGPLVELRQAISRSAILRTEDVRLTAPTARAILKYVEENVARSTPPTIASGQCSALIQPQGEERS